MEIDDKIFKLIAGATTIGFTKCAVDLCVIKAELTLNQAYTRSGRKNIDRWVREGKLIPVKRTGRMYVDRVQLETIRMVTEFKEN